ncbi:MAG: GNAT family N-acetyltransferase [Candidatus Omnitrophica bacterium]|nr:GNAT family N-acetyltransferase [Candidatus Omnitrophota bacterium]
MIQNFLFDSEHQQDWQAFFNALPSGYRDVYFSPEYLSIYESPSREKKCFVHKDGEKFFYYPFLAQKVPFLSGYRDMVTPYGYGGPLEIGEDDDFLIEAWSALRDWQIQEKIIAELIICHPLLPVLDALQVGYDGCILKMCQTVWVDLKNFQVEERQEQYTHANRKNINKALRAGFDVSIDRGKFDSKDMVRLYNATMDENQAKSFYYFNDDYFSQLNHVLGEHAALAVCRYQGQVVSAMAVLLGDVFAHCHLLGTDKAFRSSGCNNLLHHQLILWAKEQGFSKLHIGGGRTNDPNDPLLKFKENFSADKADLFVGERILAPKIYQEVCSLWEQSGADQTYSKRLLKYQYGHEHHKKIL